MYIHVRMYAQLNEREMCKRSICVSINDGKIRFDKQFTSFYYKKIKREHQKKKTVAIKA